MEKGFRNQALSGRCAHCSWGACASRFSLETKLGTVCVTHRSVCVCDSPQLTVISWMPIRHQRVYSRTLLFNICFVSFILVDFLKNKKTLTWSQKSRLYIRYSEKSQAPYLNPSPASAAPRASRSIPPHPMVNISLISGFFILILL